MKNFNKLNSIISIVLLAATVTTVGVMASGGTYSAADDPLVSLSYINDVVIPQLKTEMKAEILSELSGNIQTTPTTPETTPEPQTPPASTAYEVVHILSGQSIIAKDSCEIILRSGSAVSVTVDANQGLADLTTSTELKGSAELVKNHYIIIPRGDGRGVMATSGEAYFMVRGEYEIVG